MKNRMMFLLSAIAMFLCLPAIMNAQTEAFKVLAARGAIEVFTGKSKQGSPAACGQKLYAGDKVTMQSNTYLSIVHTSGRTLELKTAGTYTVADLAKKIPTKNSGVSARFAGYVADELTQVNEPVAAGSHKDKMATDGSVERANRDKNDQPVTTKSALSALGGLVSIPGQDKIKQIEKAVEKLHLNLSMPATSNVLDSMIAFHWGKTDGASGYTLTLKDRDGQQVLEKDVRDTVVKIDLRPLALNKNICYFWNITAKLFPPATSDDFCINILPDEEALIVRDTLRVLQKELGGEHTATNDLILAAFFEQNRMYLPAMDLYKEAIAMQPSMAVYKRTYARFLRRIGLEEAANQFQD